MADNDMSCTAPALQHPATQSNNTATTMQQHRNNAATTLQQHCNNTATTLSYTVEPTCVNFLFFPSP